MRKASLIVAALLVVTAGWYIVWRNMMEDEVAQVEATIQHHHQTIKQTTPTASLKADEVYATGFPFAFRVAVLRPTLTQIWAMETYAVSFDKIELQRKNKTDYRVIAPAHFDAMYAEDGMVPERYSIKVNEVPALLLRAETGDGPLLRFAAQMPKKLILDVTLNGETKQIGFDFLSVPIPLFTPMPSNVSYPLQIFVGMLREAMVLNKP